MPDLRDGPHHAFIDCVVGNVADELAVDLQIVDRQILEVGE